MYTYWSLAYFFSNFVAPIPQHIKQTTTKNDIEVFRKLLIVLVEEHTDMSHTTGIYTAMHNAYIKMTESHNILDNDVSLNVYITW